MRGREMHEVELVDVEHDDVADEHEQIAADRSRGTRRWWLLGIAAVVVLGLGASQWVVDARQEAAIARLSRVDGVIAPVDGTLEILRRITANESSVVLGGAGGFLVRGEDGSLTYQWGAGAASAWAKELHGPNPAMAGGEGVWNASRCLSDEDPGAEPTTAHRVVCLVTDAGTRSDIDTGDFEEVAATSSHVVVLDTADGAVLAQWPAPPSRSLTLLAEQVVLGSATDRADVATGWDMLTGDALWTYEVAAADTTQGIFVDRLGDLVMIRSSNGEFRLLSADGTPVRDAWGGKGTSVMGWQVDPPDGHLVLTVQQADGLTSLLLLAPDADPASDRTAEGSLVPFTVDDGSVPGLLLTDDGALRGWDSGTGTARWSSSATSSPYGMVPNAVVVRGLVYVADGRAVVAIDGRTGATRWSVEVGTGLVPQMLTTDGRHLLVGQDRPASDGDSVLVAYEFATGTEAFRARYPTGIDHLGSVNRMLIGFSTDYDKLALLG